VGLLDVLEAGFFAGADPVAFESGFGVFPAAGLAFVTVFSFGAGIGKLSCSAGASAL